MWLECASPPKLQGFAKLPLRLPGTADLARNKTDIHCPVAQVFLVKPEVQRSVLHVYRDRHALSCGWSQRNTKSGEQTYWWYPWQSLHPWAVATFWCKVLFLLVANAWLSFWKHWDYCSCRKWSPRLLGCQRKWPKLHTKHIDNSFQDTEL